MGRVGVPGVMSKQIFLRCKRSSNYCDNYISEDSETKRRGKGMYYNYHAKAKRLIAEGHLVRYEIVGDWNGIAPALVLFFDNYRPMPIRQYKWDEYLEFFNTLPAGKLMEVK